VLPLQNVSGDPNQEHLAGGMQQALITELARLPGFTKVIARASTLAFKSPEQTPGQIAAALGVRALVTGSIVRTGDRVRIDAQLIDGIEQRQVWGAAYERELQDVIALQNDVVSAIARATGLRLTPADRLRLEQTAAISPDTYEAYLRGMHELGSRGEGGDPRKGLAYLQQAIDRDPGDPHAYAGLAKGYAMLGHSPAAPEDAWIRARAAAERALALAPDLADAHAVMGDVKMYFEWDWPGAERAFRRANELNPNLAMNRYHYAWYLLLADRLDEAIVEHERARDLDPMTPLHTAWLADLYRIAGRYDEAIAMAQESLELNPNSAVGLAVLGHTYTDLGRHDDAIAALERAVKVAPPWTFALGISYARAGRVDDARRILAGMRARPRTSYNAWALAMLHGVLGDRDEFFEFIAHEPHHAWVPWVRLDPYLEPVRADPRFAQLMTRLRLPMPRAAPSAAAREH
jgi:TolB-like protein/Tfp pilus assembly protein PilF